MITGHVMEGDVALNDLEFDYEQAAPKQDFNVDGDTVKCDLEADALIADKSKAINQRSSNRLTKRVRKDEYSPVLLNKADVSAGEIHQLLWKSHVDACEIYSCQLKMNKLGDIEKPECSSVRSKTRRPWELWSVEDKNAFFEALCEYGKDFESIQSYIAQRSKKKGVLANMIKNKDQVRHFYYRTWHKISKFLNISENIQKQAQELYGLINYGELRKKIGGCLNEKNRIKLNELVFSGVTTVKYKGKKVRIKTPVCRALKKLNNFADTKEPELEKLPKEVFVEFRPCTNSAWLHVQDLAQNPRVRTKVCLQRRLKVAIDYLQNRWKPYRLKKKEQILNSLPNCNSEKIVCDKTPIIRVKPPRDVNIFPVSFSITDTASSSDLCLEKYITLSQKSFCKYVNKARKVINSKPKYLNDKTVDIPNIDFEKLNNGSENNLQTIAENTDSIVNNICETTAERTNNTSNNCPIKFEKTDNNSDSTSEQSYLLADKQDLYQIQNKIPDEDSYINVLTPPKSVPELDQPTEPYLTDIQKTVSSSPSKEDPSANLPVLCTDNLDTHSYDINYDSSLNTSEQNNKINSENTLDSSADESNTENFSTVNYSVSPSRNFFSFEKLNDFCEKSGKVKNICDDEDEEDIYTKTVREGWTLDEAGYLTFGELYLMLGKPSTIILEYEFEYPESITTFTCTNEITASDLSTLINKMLKVAQIYFVETRQKQLSGKQHIRSNCTKPSKPKLSGLSDKSSKDIVLSCSSLNPVPALNPKVVCTKSGIIIPSCTTNSSISSSSLSSSSTTDISTAVSAKPSSSDKHVFIMPVGTAPRAAKQSNQNSLKDEMKLLPCTRRGCRVRRKPLVVQRPLLPREGMGSLSGPRSMTVVHLVPSVTPITTVIPPCSSPKSNIPAPKKVVNILPSAMPLQVPVIKQLQPDSGTSVIMQNSISPPHVIVSSSSTEPLHIVSNTMPAVSSACTSVLNTSEEVPSTSHLELTASSDLNTLNHNILNVTSASSTTSTNTSTNQSSSKDPFASLSPLSLSDTSNFTSNVSPTFLDEFGLTTKQSSYDSTSLSSCLNLDIGSKDFTSSENSNQQSFRTNSSDIQWLNGEVDSQVRCLLDECSIDFITKFEDLADVINNSSSSDSKQT